MANCPRCGAETEILRLYRGSGASMEIEEEPSYCTPCIRENVRNARKGPCKCSEIEGDHVH